jgi:hypothetical protein
MQTITNGVVTQKSYNGWPASKDQAEIGIQSYKVEGTNLKLRCAKKVAPLLINFAKDFNQLIEPLDGKTLDDWGYCYRDVRGIPGKLSNHASGTAIDLNALLHPLRGVNTFDAAKVPMLKALVKKYGLAWGGEWTRPDPMHFEIALSPEKVTGLITKLGLDNAN